jgi:hypothetical protein
MKDDKFYKTRKLSLLFIKLEKLVGGISRVLQGPALKGCVSRKLAENKRKISPEHGDKSADSRWNTSAVRKLLKQPKA